MALSVSTCDEIMEENHSVEAPLRNVFTAWDQVLWISTFAGSRSPSLNFLVLEKERDAFGYCLDKKRLVSRTLSNLKQRRGEQQLVIPNSVSSMPLHVINAILATSAELFDCTALHGTISSFYSNLHYTYISIHFVSRNEGRILGFLLTLSLIRLTIVILH